MVDQALIDRLRQEAETAKPNERLMVHQAVILALFQRIDELEWELDAVREDRDRLYRYE